jgi:hypothetical protein
VHRPVASRRQRTRAFLQITHSRNDLGFHCCRTALGICGTPQPLNKLSFCIHPGDLYLGDEIPKHNPS